MIYCQRCQMQPATRQIQQPQGPPLALCESCATQAQFFGSMHKLLLPALMHAQLPAVQACPGCHLSWQQLNQSSHIGCPQCYTHFRSALEATLTRLHGQTSHTGRRPHRTSSPRPEDSLRQELEQAIAEERFEDAARLRDQLRKREETP